MLIWKIDYSSFSLLARVSIQHLLDWLFPSGSGKRSRLFGVVSRRSVLQTSAPFAPLSPVSQGAQPPCWESCCWEEKVYECSTKVHHWAKRPLSQPLFLSRLDPRLSVLKGIIPFINMLNPWMLLKRTPWVAEMCYTTTSPSHWAAGSTIHLLGHRTGSQSKQQGVLLPCYHIFSLIGFHLGKVVSCRNKQFKVLMLGD